MNHTELKTFLTIIETGSLVKAAKRLNVTQSTVTTRLSSLESQTGQRLINRKKSGVTLTASGERLSGYADTIVNLWQQARRETALPHAMSALCNFCCHTDLWRGLGEDLSQYISTYLPEVALSVWSGSDEDIARWMASGLSDIALTFSPHADQTQILFHGHSAELVLVSTDPDAPVRFNPNYVFVENGDEFRRDHAAAYSDADTARFSFGNAELGLNHLLDKGGSAYLPLRSVEKYVSEARLFILGEAPRFTRNTYVIGNKSAVENWPWFDDAIKTLTR